MERNQNGYPTTPQPSPEGNSDTRTRCDGGRLCSMEGMAIGYAYVPQQKFRMLYSAENALSHGTLFEELYLPFGVYGK